MISLTNFINENINNKVEQFIKDGGYISFGVPVPSYEMRTEDNKGYKIIDVKSYKDIPVTIDEFSQYLGNFDSFHYGNWQKFSEKIFGNITLYIDGDMHFGDSIQFNNKSFKSKLKKIHKATNISDVDVEMVIDLNLIGTIGNNFSDHNLKITLNKDELKNFDDIHKHIVYELLVGGKKHNDDMHIRKVVKL